MTTTQTDQPTPRKPLRLWPGVVAAVLLTLLRYVVPIVIPDAGLFPVLGGLGCVLVIVLWWLFFSRAPWSERIGAIVLMIVALFATSRVIHVSLARGGMGILFPFLAVPILSLALVGWAAATRNLSSTLRRASMVGTMLFTCGVFTLLRTGGVSGEGGSDLHWRWTPSPEQRLLSQQEPAPQISPQPKPSPQVAGNDWPGFRGLARDGVVRGVRIETNWSQFPPVQVWRQPIGPGWSSFAVRGDFLYTQEQRGEDELVACYRVSTGEPVWRHRDEVRFWESNAGAGPRATPTLSQGRLYTFGATGILNALEATNGAVVWSRNVAAETQTKVPMWGFSSSPLVVEDVVIVGAIGKLAAYEIASGTPRWFGPPHGGSYSSPHLANIGGVEQILLLTGDGATSVAATNGAVLWEHSWPSFAIVQPALTADGDVLMSICGAAGGIGTRRLAVARGQGGWTVQERWTSNGLKPYFNDLVVHRGHAFGFDNSILSCIDLQDGKRKWKGGRYGNGQLLLLADQELLLVLSEKGELALVGAGPDEFKEIARFPAIQGKTWNHPAVAGDVLLVRNSEEMAAFRLALAKR
jgi:outer membrane protein assembly factor BamB